MQGANATVRASNDGSDGSLGPAAGSVQGWDETAIRGGHR